MFGDVGIEEQEVVFAGTCSTCQSVLCRGAWAIYKEDDNGLLTYLAEQGCCSDTFYIRFFSTLDQAVDEIGRLIREALEDPHFVQTLHWLPFEGTSAVPDRAHVH